MSNSSKRHAKTKNMKFACHYLIIRKINLNCFEIDRDTCYNKKEHKILGNYSAPVVGGTDVNVKNDQIGFVKNICSVLLLNFNNQ